MDQIHISLGSILQTKGQISSGLTILLVLRGSLALKSPDQNRQLGENQLAVINGGDFYALESERSNVVLRVNPDRECLDRLCPEVLQYRFACCSTSANTATEPLYDSLRKRVTRMALLQFRHEERYELLLRAELLQILHTLMLNFREAGEASGRSQDPRLAPILRAMERGYREPMGLEETARTFYLSAPYLSRLFRREMGMTFMEYLNSLRLEGARHDLLYSDYSVTRIALNSGFAGVQALNRAFKQQFGCPPAEYRRQVRPDSGGEDHVLELQADPNGSLELLARFMDTYEGRHSAGEIRKSICLDVPGAPLRRPERLLDVGELRYLLRKETHAQLWQAQRSIGFTYLYFSGLFSAQNGLLQRLEVLELFDLLLEQKLTPFVAVEPAREIQEIPSVLDALRRRFGGREMEGWKFELSGEGSPEQFCAAAQAIRSASPGSAVGLHVNPRRLAEWLSAGNQPQWLPALTDFITTESDPNGQAAPSDAFTYERFQKRYHETTLLRLRAWMEETGLSAPIYLTAWNTLTGRSIVEAGEFHRTALIADTIQMLGRSVAGFAVRLNLESGMGLEHDLLTYPLSLFLYHGIKRNLFFVMRSMRAAGEHVLYEEEGLLVTRDGADSYVVQVWHPCYIDPFQTLGNLRRDDYRRSVRLSLQGLRRGTYRVKTLYLDRDNGSTYRSWVKVDLSVSLDDDVLDYLRNFSNPSVTLEERTVTDCFELNQSLALNGAALWSIRRIPDGE